MGKSGRLIFFCGKMGAGKTTMSHSIAKNELGIRLSEDEWLSSHYPEQIETFQDYLKHSSLIKPFVRSLATNLLTTGNTVVMDFPANTVRQREWFKSLCNETECTHELIYLAVSNEVCLEQISKRRKEQPERAQFDTEAVFNEVAKYFEAPTDSESLNIVQSRKNA